MWTGLILALPLVEWKFITTCGGNKHHKPKKAYAADFKAHEAHFTESASIITAAGMCSVLGSVKWDLTGHIGQILG